MVINRVRNREPRCFGQIGIELLNSGIQPSDNPLQFCEFLHQFGSQIGLGQVCSFMNDTRAHGKPAVSHGLAQPTAQPLQSNRLFVITAEVFLEGNFFQPAGALPERVLLVYLPEETCVVEAGSQNALVAMPDDSVWIAIGVQHGEEVGQQPAICILDREIFLMVTHHRNQDFLGQFQKLAIKRSQYCRGPLCKVYHEFEQQLVFAPARAGNRTSRRIQRFANLHFSCFTTENLCLLQSGHISRSSTWNPNWCVPENAVSTGLIASADAIEFQRYNF